MTLTTHLRPKNTTRRHEPHYEPIWKQEKIARIPVRWAWHYGMLHSLRERLLQEQENEIAAVTQPVEAHSMSVADSATDEFDHVMAICLLAREHNALFEIDAAIHRILNGTYGLCEESGKPIPAGRLRVVPWTRYTREAQDRREREGLDAPPGIPPLSSIQGRGAPALAGAENLEADELLTREVEQRQLEADLRTCEEVMLDDLMPSMKPNGAKFAPSLIVNKNYAPSSHHQPTKP